MKEYEYKVLVKRYGAKGPICILKTDSESLAIETCNLQTRETYVEKGHWQKKIHSNGESYPDKSEYSARHVSPMDESNNVYKTVVYS